MKIRKGNPERTYIMMRADQLLYLMGLAVSSLFDLVWDTDFFKNFSLAFLLAIGFTFIRDWREMWGALTYVPIETQEELDKVQ